MKPNIDITTDDWKVLQHLLGQHLPGVEIWAFGSRVKWSARPDSDLDLVVFATESQQPLVHELKDALDESSLPFRVDVLVWEQISEAFRDNIRRQYVVLMPAPRVRTAAQTGFVAAVGRVSAKRVTRQVPDAVMDGDAPALEDVGLRCANPTYGAAGWWWRGWGMSAEWQDTTLGKICAIQGGAIQTGPFGSQLHTSDYKKFGIPVVMPTNIGDGGIVLDNIARIDQADVDRLSQHKLQVGDIVFSRRGDVTKNALIRQHEAGWFCGTGCLKVRLGDETIATAKFISHCLRLPDIKDWLIRHAVGATMPNLNTGILSAVPIYLPPLQVQIEIAAILSALDDRITLLRETNATLEAIAQALFKSWFVDFDPVRAKMEGSAPEGMDEATAALFPDSFEESELGLVPRGWRASTLADTFEINPPRKLSKGSMASYLDMASVATSGHCVETPTLREISSGAKFQNGDTLLARITPCLENGKSAFVDFLAEGQIGWGSTEFLVLRPKVPLPEYFGYLLGRHPAFREYARQSMSGTSGRQRIQTDVLGRYLLAVPDRDIALVFAEVIEPIQRSIAANHQTARTLATLRDTLLPRLISGQLRLPETQATEDEIA